MEKGEGPRYYTEAKDTKSKQRVAQEAEIMFHFRQQGKERGSNILWMSRAEGSLKPRCNPSDTVYLLERFSSAKVTEG